MGIIKKLWNWAVSGPFERQVLKFAFRKIEERGLCIVRIEHKAGTNYLIDINGVAHKIGKRA